MTKSIFIRNYFSSRFRGTSWVDAFKLCGLEHSLTLA